ncbi:MAG: L-aspartate oxidase, partial [Campylobacterota bacterium]
PLELPGDKEKKDALRRVMWDHVSIVRTPKGLQNALEAIEEMLRSGVGRLLRLRLLTARCIVQSAQNRTESIGVHFITQGDKE